MRKHRSARLFATAVFASLVIVGSLVVTNASARSSPEVKVTA